MRSARMAESLETLGRRSPSMRPTSSCCARRAAALADAMLGDVAHWRFATETRDLGDARLASRPALTPVRDARACTNFAAAAAPIS